MIGFFRWVFAVYDGGTTIESDGGPEVFTDGFIYGPDGCGSNDWMDEELHAMKDELVAELPKSDGLYEMVGKLRLSSEYNGYSGETDTDAEIIEFNVRRIPDDFAQMMNDINDIKEAKPSTTTTPETK